MGYRASDSMANSQTEPSAAMSMDSTQVTGVAYWAHVGGFGAGFVAAVTYNRIVPRDELERSIAIFFARGRYDLVIDL